MYYETVWPKFWVDACCAVWCFKSSSNSLCLFILLFIFFFTRRLSFVREENRKTDRQTVAETMHPGPFALSDSWLAGKPFLSNSVSYCWQTDATHAIYVKQSWKQTLCFLFSLNVVVFNLGDDAWDLLLHKNRGS